MRKLPSRRRNCRVCRTWAPKLPVQQGPAERAFLAVATRAAFIALRHGEWLGRVLQPVINALQLDTQLPLLEEADNPAQKLL